jgi:hypothetical protein
MTDGLKEVAHQPPKADSGAADNGSSVRAQPAIDRVKLLQRATQRG